jgi:hypothetical protein
MRFNPPPGWPSAPPGWEPPPGWQPNPSWPPPPPGWQLWVDDTMPPPTPPSMPTQQMPAQYRSAPQMPAPQMPGQYAPQAPPPYSPVPAAPAPSGSTWFWTVGGGAAVFLGSLLPFVSGSDTVNGGINGGARVSSAVFGLILAGLGAAIAFAPPRPGPRGRSLGLGITLLVLSGLGLLGYVIFTAIGAAGVNQSGGFGTKVTYSPSVGIILAILGCAAAVVGSILVLRRLPARQ